MSKKFVIWGLGVLALVLVLGWIAGCAPRQPPGGGIYRGLT